MERDLRERALRVLGVTAEPMSLTDAWLGRIYIVPPYGRAIGSWVQRLVNSYGSRNVTQAIALVPARTDTKWWHDLLRADALVCFVRGRVRFYPSTGGAPFPSAIVHLGRERARFLEVFAATGDIWELLAAPSAFTTSSPSPLEGPGWPRIDAGSPWPGSPPGSPARVTAPPRAASR